MDCKKPAPKMRAVASSATAATKAAVCMEALLDGCEVKHRRNEERASEGKREKRKQKGERVR